MSKIIKRYIVFILHEMNYKVRTIINVFYYITGNEGPVVLYFLTVTLGQKQSN